MLDSVSIAPVQTASSLTFSHTTSASLTDSLLLVGVALDQPDAVTSVSYGASSLTELTTWTADSTFVQLHVAVFYLQSPPAGTADVVISLSNPHAINAGAYSMGNVAGLPVALGSAKARTTDPTLDIAPTTPGLVFEFLGKEANHLVTPAPTNELGWDMCGPGYARFASSFRMVDEPTTLFWTYECCPDEWILGAVLVIPR